MVSFILDRVKTLAGFAPQAFSGTTAVDTAAIDRTGFDSAVVIINNADATGNPTAVSLTVTMSDGATSSPADAVTFSATPAVISAKTAGLTMYQFNLAGIKKYFKITATPAFTAGTDPAVIAGCTVMLVGARVDPATGTAITPLRKA